MKVECPQCGTHVEKPLEGEPVCPNCGYGSQAGAPSRDETAAGGMSPPDASEGGAPAGQTGTPYGGTPAGQPGATQYGPPAGAAQPPRQGLAITALVLGIVGCCLIPVLPSIAAIVVGAIAMKKNKEEPETYGGHGMALAGLILGIVGLVLGLILVAFYAAIFAVILDCEENPDQEICQDIEDENQVVDASPGVPTAATAPAWFALAPAWRTRPHAV